MLKFTDDECLAIIAESGIPWDIPFPSVDVRDVVALSEAQERGYRSLAVRDLVRYDGGRATWARDIEHILELAQDVNLVGRIVPTAAFDTAPELLVIASGADEDAGLVRIDADGVHSVQFVRSNIARRAVFDAALQVFEDTERDNCYIMADERSGLAWIVTTQRVRTATWVDDAWLAGAETTLDDVFSAVLGTPATAAA